MNDGNKLDQSMDLRDSFAELEKAGSRVEFQSCSENSSGKSIPGSLH